MNTLPLYQIVDYQQHFENAKSLCYVKPQFVCVPNKHGGTGLSNVQGEPDGAAIYGIWMWILQMCSRQTCGNYDLISGKKTFRSSRAGYLTADGTESGRRLSARELSNMFRQDINLILSCLRVIQSPEVGFIRLVDGVPEHLDAGSVPASATVIPTARASSPETADRATSNSSTERKNRTEEKERNLALVEEDSTESPIHNAATVVTEPESGVAEQDVVQHAEAKLLLGKLAKDVFPDEAPGVIWDNKLEHDLDEMLPLNRQVLEKVDWAYRLPENERLFEDGPRGGGMMRVKSFASLIPNLRREASKITAARRKLGLNGLHAPKKAADPAPARWEEAFVALWGDRSDRPARFEDLTGSQRTAVREKTTQLAELSATTTV